MAAVATAAGGAGGRGLNRGKSGPRETPVTGNFDMQGLREGIEPVWNYVHDETTYILKIDEDGTETSGCLMYNVARTRAEKND